MAIPKDILAAILKHEKWLDDNEAINRIISAKKAERERLRGLKI